MDGGVWTQAWLLTGLCDPCTKPRFAAPHSQLSAVAAYSKAVGELRKSLQGNNAPEREGGHEEDSGGHDGAKAKGRGKAKA